MLVLDTQTLIWWVFDDSKLGDRAAAMIEDYQDSDGLAVSSFTLWEISLLQRKGRMSLIPEISEWWESLADDGVVPIDVSVGIAVRANELEDFHDDPADRIIVATALEGHQLMTSDQKILRWGGELERVNARV